ncbi:metal-dependent hydrolase [Photobacterium sanctipauli]|uniref:Metal-dependent hydrolase n=1 Tax=Photobacterium sanctipauli TaxID=1342794 RepID=A0A2T3NN81_9GAMM|nr:metal-dependent hydrolase [Photobacterium sanctipauli]PSW16975.1 metal-dependent hydrolase [Photobacterium sanctipauli]
MANFKTHLGSAAITSSLAATALLSAGHIVPITALWLMLLGTVGGLLPDIDSDNSTSMSTLFRLFAGLITFSFVGHIYKMVSMLELMVYGAFCYLTIRYNCKSTLEKITVHRGCCHSIAFISASGLFTVWLLYLLGYSDITAWLSGTFLFFGGVVHLALDEIYSVDLANRRLKLSFGSALKIFSPKNPFLSALQCLLIGMLYIHSPSWDNTWKEVSNWSEFRFKPDWLNREDVTRFFDSVISSTKEAMNNKAS